MGSTREFRGSLTTLQNTAGEGTVLDFRRCFPRSRATGKAGSAAEKEGTHTHSSSRRPRGPGQEAGVPGNEGTGAVRGTRPQTPQLTPGAQAQQGVQHHPPFQAFGNGLLFSRWLLWAAVTPCGGQHTWKSLCSQRHCGDDGGTMAPPKESRAVSTVTALHRRL